MLTELVARLCKQKEGCPIVVPIGLLLYRLYNPPFLSAIHFIISIC